jgi:hypothetical protein
VKRAGSERHGQASKLIALQLRADDTDRQVVRSSWPAPRGLACSSWVRLTVVGTTFTGGNQAVRDHAAEGKDLLLF